MRAVKSFGWLHHPSAQSALAQMQARRDCHLLVRGALWRQLEQDALARHLRAQFDNIPACSRLLAVPQKGRVGQLEPGVYGRVRSGTYGSGGPADRCLS
jgi:hypothetical protein